MKENKLIGIYRCGNREIPFDGGGEGCENVFEKPIVGTDLPLVVDCPLCGHVAKFLDFWLDGRIFTLVECPTAEQISEATERRNAEEARREVWENFFSLV